MFAIMPSKKASVEIVYPKSWGQRLLSVAGVVASYLFVAAVAFWAGTRVDEDPALRNFIETTSAVASALNQAKEPASALAAKPPQPKAEPDWNDISLDGLAITQALASLTTNSGNQISYDLTLVNKGRRFTGSMEILVAGSTPTGSLTHAYKKSGPPNKEGRNELVSVGRFLRTRGEFSLPANFTPRTVFVRLLEEGEVRASKVLQISPGNEDQKSTHSR